MFNLDRYLLMQSVGAQCVSPVEETIVGWGQYKDQIPPSEQAKIDKLAEIITDSFNQFDCAPFRSMLVVGHADKDWHGPVFEKQVSFERATAVQKAITAKHRELWTSRGMGPPPMGGVEWEVKGEGSTKMVAKAFHSENRRVVVTLARKGAPLPRPDVSSFVSGAGTPINSKRTKLMIDIFGERETEPGFTNYTTDPAFSRGGDGVARPWTKDPNRPPGLEAKSASDICLRSSPMNANTLDEMARIAAPGARFTIALNTGPKDGIKGGTDEQLQHVRDKFPNRKTIFDGVHHGTISDTGKQEPTDRKVLVFEIP